MHFMPLTLVYQNETEYKNNFFFCKKIQPSIYQYMNLTVQFPKLAISRGGKCVRRKENQACNSSHCFVFT